MSAAATLSVTASTETFIWALVVAVSAASSLVIEMVAAVSPFIFFMHVTSALRPEVGKFSLAAVATSTLLWLSVRLTVGHFIRVAEAGGAPSVFFYYMWPVLVFELLSLFLIFGAIVLFKALAMYVHCLRGEWWDITEAVCGGRGVSPCDSLSIDVENLLEESFPVALILALGTSVATVPVAASVVLSLL
jgi:hypothetical protein